MSRFRSVQMATDVKQQGRPSEGGVAALARRSATSLPSSKPSQQQ